jgi:multiple sugar transport system ATP-binding protein
MGEIRLDRLVKRFGDEGNEIVAVNDLNITIEDGEFLVLVGPSGCGKSTTLRCVAGLEIPSEGSIYIDDDDVTRQKPKDRDIAMVFQNYALYPHMTAKKNMSFGLRMSGKYDDEEIDRIVEETAEMMGIEDLLDDLPGELSGGQQQRVALGRAIVREPAVFLMDEPLSNLDAKLRTTMRTELQSLQQELGTTTIYVTHDQTEAMTMGDRIAILNGGELQQIGTPLECYHDPNNRFVAGFIGAPSMNFLEVTQKNGTLEHEEFEYEISEEISQRIRGEGPEFTLGIRPEDIELSDGTNPNEISLTVDVVEPMGDLSHLYLELGAQQITATVNGRTNIQSGDEIELVFPENQVHLFDKETGKSLKTSEVFDSEDGSDAIASHG